MLRAELLAMRPAAVDVVKKTIVTERHPERFLGEEWGVRVWC